MFFSKQPEVAKKFISERLHGDELHIAHNDTVLLDGYERAGFRGPITDQLRVNQMKKFVFFSFVFFLNCNNITKEKDSIIVRSTR